MSGDVAWIMSEGRAVGQAGNRATAHLTVETMVLARGSDGLCTKHIRFSSRAAPAT